MVLAVETLNLTKYYHQQVGCRDVSITVASGHVFGLLGPNGAGKSTLVKTLVGLIKPTAGRAVILGKPLGSSEVNEKIGFLPELFRYQEWLSGRELLGLHGQLYKMSKEAIGRRIPEVLEIVGLQSAENKKVGTYSKGMQQRIGIACAIMNSPRLIFLDEPTSALDPLGRREVRNIIQRLKNEGTTIFLNSHLLSEVEMVCDQVAIINNGKMIAQGNLKELLIKKLEVVLEIEGASPGLLEEFSQMAINMEHQGNEFVLELDSVERIPVLAKRVVETGGRLYNLQYRQISLEDLFVQLLEKEGE